MADSKLDLSKMFQSVSNILVKNKENLNQADSYNHDHGDHMVDIFKVITQAMEAKKGAEPADQLAYASELLRKGPQSGSAGLYSKGLWQAAQQFKDQKITGGNAMQLVQTILGGGQTPVSAQAPKPSGDLLGSLLSRFTGSGAQEDQGIDSSDLLAAGMAFFQSKQSGESTLEALVDAAVASSQMSGSAHRTMSGKLVANTLMKTISSLMGA